MLLDIADLHVHYGKIEAIGGISLTVEEGEIVTLIGANGAGKTTTLKTISGLRRPSAGAVRFDGRDITGVPGHQRVKLGLCQAPEGRGIFPGMTVLENLEMGAYVRSRRASNELDRVLTLFPRLAERRKQQGGTLSGGEQQMLAIGRALMAEPKLLLLDEPSMGLAPLIVAQIFKILREINDLGTTILLVEQNAVQALALSHRAYVLETGKIVASGPAAELLDDPALRAAYLGAELGAAVDGENSATGPAS
jgi:branched-chain amino acid transport system ATP-binding protein